MINDITTDADEGMKKAVDSFKRGERSPAKVRSVALNVLRGIPGAKIDYVELREPSTLAPVKRLAKGHSRDEQPRLSGRHSGRYFVCRRFLRARPQRRRRQHGSRDPHRNDNCSGSIQPRGLGVRLPSEHKRIISPG